MIVWATLLGAGLLLTIAAGVLVHELLHALVLRSAGVTCSVTLGSTSRTAGGFQTLVSGAVASVDIESVPAACSPWRLRLAAMAPLVMLLPIGVYAWLLTQGVLADSLAGSLLVIAWMACALPSPADFAIVWHTDDAIAEAAKRP